MAEAIDACDRNATSADAAETDLGTTPATDQSAEMVCVSHTTEPAFEWLVRRMKDQWRRGPPDASAWTWCESNVQGRIDAWTVLVTVAGFLGAFALGDIAGLESSDEGSSSFQKVMLAVHGIGLAIATGALLSATLMLSAVVWNVQREMASDQYLYANKSTPRIRAAIGDNFEIGYGAWCRLKTFAPKKGGKEGIMPFGINVVDASGKLLVIGVTSYIFAVCAKILASVDELWVSIPCVVIVIGVVLFSLVCVVRMGLELS